MVSEGVLQEGLLIPRHDVKHRDQIVDPVNKDEWNQKVIWLMTSVTKWIVRQLCYTTHFKTWGLRQACDVCNIYNLLGEVWKGDLNNVDLPVNAVVKLLFICTLVTIIINIYF